MIDIFNINLNKIMTLKAYNFYRMLATIIIAALISVFINLENFLVPIVTVITGMLLLYMLKKQVKEVIVDERDYELAGKAARYAITAFGFLSSIAVIILFALRTRSPLIEMAGSVLAYSVCLLMLLYTGIFSYYRDERSARSKKIFIALVIAAAFAVAIFGARFFSGEDDWICENGAWVKHGHPDSPMPTSVCK